MARTKFEKKTKFTLPVNPLTITVAFLIIALITLGVIRYTISRSQPFINKASADLDYLLFRLEMEQEKYHFGEPVKLRMKIQNTSNKPVTLNFPYSEEVDFWVYREDDWLFFKFPTLIWKYSKYKNSVAQPHKITLQPKEVKIFSGVWPQAYQNGKRVPPGIYRIVCKVEANDFAISMTLRGNSEKEP